MNVQQMTHKANTQIALKPGYTLGYGKLSARPDEATDVQSELMPCLPAYFLSKVVKVFLAKVNLQH